MSEPKPPPLTLFMPHSTIPPCPRGSEHWSNVEAGTPQAMREAARQLRASADRAALPDIAHALRSNADRLDHAADALEADQ